MTLPVIDPDIEEELNHNEAAHSIAICQACIQQGRTHPPAGSIVEVLCGRLVRWIMLPQTAPLCDDCKEEFGKPKNCHWCGRLAK